MYRCTHANEEEHFIVLEGNVHLTNGDELDSVDRGSCNGKGELPMPGAISPTAESECLSFSPPVIWKKRSRLIGSMDGGDLAAIAESAKKWGLHDCWPAAF